MSPPSLRRRSFVNNADGCSSLNQLSTNLQIRRVLFQLFAIRTVFVAIARKIQNVNRCVTGDERGAGYSAAAAGCDVTESLQRVARTAPRVQKPRGRRSAAASCGPIRARRESQRELTKRGRMRVCAYSASPHEVTVGVSPGSHLVSVAGCRASLLPQRWLRLAPAAARSYLCNRQSMHAEEYTVAVYEDDFRMFCEM